VLSGLLALFLSAELLSRAPDGATIPVPIGDSTEWQYWVIETVKRYEEERGHDRHPVKMTMQFPVPDQTKVDKPLFAGPADWIWRRSR
jgi:hypothetical protein